MVNGCEYPYLGELHEPNVVVPIMGMISGRLDTVHLEAPLRSERVCSREQLGVLGRHCRYVILVWWAPQNV